MFAIGNAPWSRSALIAAMPEFLQLWKTRPWGDNRGGMGATHMFFTWFAVRQLAPQCIVESGVYNGAGTWMLEQAAPAAKIICIEPRKHRPAIYVKADASYRKRDFNLQNWDRLDKANTLLFFDDHYGWQRVMQARTHGFSHLMYEDNWPVYGGVELSVKAALAGHKVEAALVLAQHKVKAARAGQGPAAAPWLQDHLEVYHEFPPIYPNLHPRRGWLYAKYAAVTHPPLLTEPDPAFTVFERDVTGYTYMAYARIKQSQE